MDDMLIKCLILTKIVAEIKNFKSVCIGIWQKIFKKYNHKLLNDHL